jgi:hypothetical protein
VMAACARRRDGWRRLASWCDGCAERSTWPHRNGSASRIRMTRTGRPCVCLTQWLVSSRGHASMG